MTIYQEAVFAFRLRTCRKSCGLTLTELADRCQVTPGAICNFEHKRSLPTVQILVKIADVLGVRTDHLLGRDEYTP